MIEDPNDPNDPNETPAPESTEPNDSELTDKDLDDAAGGIHL